MGVAVSSVGTVQIIVPCRLVVRVGSNNSGVVSFHPPHLRHHQRPA